MLRRFTLLLTVLALIAALFLFGARIGSGAGAGPLDGLHQADKRIGAVDAPVVITEYVDLLCAACARHSDEIGAVLLDEARSGRVVIERMPIAHVAEESRGLAYAALAAAQQDRMWQFTQRWFERMNDGSATANATEVMRVARDAGLDLDRFARDFADTNERSNELRGVTAVARNDGVVVTPTLIITGADGVRHVSGIATADAVRAEIAAVE